MEKATELHNRLLAAGERMTTPDWAELMERWWAWAYRVNLLKNPFKGTS
jgi:hypothetical protein